MTVNKDAAGRRNSIAVTSQNKAHPGHRRRAHSIAPGDRPSPTSRARRSLVCFIVVQTIIFYVLSRLRVKVYSKLPPTLQTTEMTERKPWT